MCASPGSPAAIPYLNEYSRVNSYPWSSFLSAAHQDKRREWNFSKQKWNLFQLKQQWNIVELILTLGALFPRGGPVQDQVLTLTAGSNRLCLVFSLYWRSLESGDSWFRSRQMKKMVWSQTAVASEYMCALPWSHSKCL